MRQPGYQRGNGALLLALIVGLVALIIILFTFAHSASAQENQEDEVLGGMLPPGGTWVVGDNDTCSRIATALGRPGEWHQLLYTGNNVETISRAAQQTGIPFGNCPLLPGVELEIPWQWVGQPVVVRAVRVPTDNDWPHWRTALAAASIVAFGAGVVVHRYRYGIRTGLKAFFSALRRRFNKPVQPTAAPSQ